MSEEKPKYISIIKWVDQSYTYGPMKKDDMLGECVGTTTGFYITEDKKTVAIAAEWFEFRDDYRSVIQIPKVAILSHRKIKI